MAVKKAWKQPLIKSIDNLGMVMGGTCGIGNSVSPDVCNIGNGASTGSCSRGKGAKVSCGTGNGGN